MSVKRLKYGGKSRRKAMLGADAAIMAAATLAAAGMTTAATISSAKSQAQAMVNSAKTQAQSIKDQTANNNTLQKESINFTRQQNQENRQQQQDIQTTLQMLAGQENMNDRMEANKLQLKMGGRPKKRSIKSTHFYRGGSAPFQVTDGGGVIPVQVDNNGYGLYELYGNDHEHSHKTPGGKRKTGVGIKFANGSVVEGEGNQNTNQGELMYVTPNDAVFISKHSIAGFNPTEAVKQGVHPVDAFNTQEIIKAEQGLKDDGSKAKCGTRRSLKRTLGGFSILNNAANLTQLPSNNTAAVAGGTAYAIQPIDKTSSPVARCGKRISLKRCGGRVKANYGHSVFDPNDYFNPGGNKITTSTTTTNDNTSKRNIFSRIVNSPHAGAMINAAGNLAGAGLTMFGNMYAGKKLGQAYSQAGDILADAYSQMKGIDMSELKREDYEAPHSIAVIRDANTNINPQLERIRRNSASERREINRGTMSSAARQQRLAGTNDRMMQRMSEQYAYKQNADEQIKQGNAERITQVSQANADRDTQARRDWGTQRLSLLQYNNSIENSKITGMAQARADALNQAASTNASALQSSLAGIGSALQSSASDFATAFAANRKEKIDFTNTYIGLGNEDQVKAAILRYKQTGDKSFINGLLEGNTISGKERLTLRNVINKKN